MSRLRRHCDEVSANEGRVLVDGFELTQRYWPSGQRGLGPETVVRIVVDVAVFVADVLRMMLDGLARAAEETAVFVALVLDVLEQGVLLRLIRDLSEAC